VEPGRRRRFGLAVGGGRDRWGGGVGVGWRDVRWLTINAMKSAFWPFDDRLRLINDVIKPGFDALVSP
jgi:hypothetical protein